MTQNYSPLPTTERSFANFVRHIQEELTKSRQNTRDGRVPQEFEELDHYYYQRLIATLSQSTQNLSSEHLEQLSLWTAQLINNTPRSTLEQKTALLKAIRSTIFHPHHALSTEGLKTSLQRRIGHQAPDIQPAQLLF